jgi:hypothetical protein
MRDGKKDKVNTTTRPDDFTEAHRSLWRNVLMQAARDATAPVRPSTTTKALHDTRQAQAWFRFTNADFVEVCENAGICPRIVATAYENGTINRMLAR